MPDEIEYLIYPQIDSQFAFPPAVRAAIAASPELTNLFAKKTDVPTAAQIAAATELTSKFALKTDAVTVAAASATVAGVTKFATKSETIEGVVTDKAVTPEDFKSAIGLVATTNSYRSLDDAPVLPAQSSSVHFLVGNSGASIPGVTQDMMGTWMARDTWANVAGAQWLKFNTGYMAWINANPTKAVDLGVPLIPHDMDKTGANWNTLLDQVIANASVTNGSTTSTTDSIYTSLGGSLSDASPVNGIAYARIWWEFNMNPIANNIDRTKFINAWNRAIPLIRAGFAARATAQGRTNQRLKIVFCPISDGADYTAFYPTNANVDIIAQDTYGQVYGTAIPTSAALISHVQGYLDALTTFANSKGKPMALGEYGNWQKGTAGSTGAHGLADFPGYIDTIFNWAVAQNVEYLCYFNIADGGVGITMADTPNSLAEYQIRAIGTTSGPLYMATLDSGTRTLATTQIPAYLLAAALDSRINALIVASGGGGTSTPSLTNSTAPAISGTTTVGQTLSVTNGTWVATPDSYTYQWKRAGTAISGATANTYTTVSADNSAAITCTVTAVKAGYLAGSATSNSVSITAAPSGDTTPPTTPTGVSVDSGMPKVLVQWAASTDAVGVTSYNIYRSDSTAVLGTSTTTQYIDTTATVGTAYTYQVAALDAAGNMSAKSSASPSITITAAPSVSIVSSDGFSGAAAAAIEGRSTDSAAGGTAKTWVSDIATSGWQTTYNTTMQAQTTDNAFIGLPVPSANAFQCSTLIVAAPGSGQHSLSFKVGLTGTDSIEAIYSVDSNSVILLAFINGQTNYFGGQLLGTNSKLTGNRIGMRLFNNVVTVELAGTIILARALPTAWTGTITHAGIKKYTSSGTYDDFRMEQLTSAASVVTMTNTKAPSLGGNPRLGNTINVDYVGSYSATPESYTYQWKQAGVDIAGATTSSYTIVSGDVGKAITCSVTAIKAGYTTVTTLSNVFTPTAAQTVSTYNDSFSGTVGSDISRTTPNTWATKINTGTTAVTQTANGAEFALSPSSSRVEKLSAMAVSIDTDITATVKLVSSAQQYAGALFIIGTDELTTNLTADSSYPKNGYVFRLQFSQTGAGNGSYYLGRIVNDTKTDLTTQTYKSLVVGTAYKIRFQRVSDKTIRYKVWLATASEPAAWDFSYPDTNTVAGGKAAIGVVTISNTTAAATVAIDDVTVVTSSY